MDARKDILAEAVAAWRGASRGEEFSGRAKTALFAEVRALGDSSEAAFVPAVARAWRWAFLGSVPVVALAAVLMLAGDHGSAGGRLTASKEDGHVTFTLANGSAQHVIYRSTDPQAFDRASAVKMARNTYTENATGGPNLVFYRID